MRPASSTPPHWLHVLAHLDPAFGGLSAAVPELVAALNQSEQCTSEIAAFCSAGEVWPVLPDGVAATRWPLSRASWVRDQAMRRSFRDLVARCDGVHIHGLWEQSTLVAARVARAQGKPYVLSAHGMLDTWALRNKALKKAVYAALLERRHVAAASGLHALTRAEANDYRSFLQASDPPLIAVIPNGVRIPPRHNPEPFLAAFPGLRRRRLILFLGRIHFKKGVDTLIRAWATLAESHPDAHLVLAGPDFEGTRLRSESLVTELHLAARVTFTGMLRSDLKWSALAAAGVFVLPSLSEGFSVSVLEAMGTGLPVIVTPDCHLDEVSDTDSGWITQSEVEPLASSLEKFLSNSAESNHSMGSRGRELVRQRFTWSSVAQTMAALYQDLTPRCAMNVLDGRQSRCLNT